MFIFWPLFYRLNVFPIRVPPLRERADAIPILVRHFTKLYANRMNKQIDSIASETMTALSQYHWPGNVRELQNVIERAVVMTKGALGESGGECSCLAEVATQPHDGQQRIDLGKAPQQPRRLIGAAVIDKDEFVRPADIIEDGSQPRMQFDHIPAFVVEGDNNRQHWRVLAVTGQCTAQARHSFHFARSHRGVVAANRIASRTLHPIFTKQHAARS